MEDIVELYKGQNLDGKHGEEEDKDKKEDDEDDILSHLNYRKLEKISDDFRKNPKGLSLTEYLKVMLKHLPDVQDKPNLVKNLIELFKQIDVNGDETLEWDEFSNHIIELGMMQLNNYYASDIIDDEKHDTEVEHVFFIEKLKHLLVMERDQKRFKVYDCKTGKFKQNVPDKSGSSGGAVIAADYCEHENLVATTSNNNSINLWDSNNYIFRQRIPTSEIQLTVKWCEPIQQLFTGGCDSVIHTYNVVDCEEIGVREGWNPLKKDKVGHEGPILDLLPIYEKGYLVSCGIDAQICLWNLKTLEGKHTLVGHQLGVYCLDWYADSDILLSAGLEHDVYVWNPLVDKRIFLLKGHNHSLVGVKHLKGTYQLISADISGMFRVWDVRTFTTIQTFNCPLNEINCYALTWPPKRIVAGGRRLIFYDYDEPTDHHLADDQQCLCVLYNPIFYTFITAHPKCIKVWDACTGKLQSVFRELSTKDITCICLDERQRKLFVGNCKGHVFSINIKNGAPMKKFEDHKGDVSCLCYWGDKNILLSSSWDKNVQLQFSSSKPEGPKRFEMDKHKSAVNFIDFKPDHTLCASCSDDCTVIIYNYGSYRQEGLLTEHELEVKICKFLNPYHVLASADLDGRIYFWGVMPSASRNELLCVVKNDTESEVGTIENFPIRGMDFDPVNKILYTGDEMGFMHKWDVSRLINKVQDLDRIVEETKGHKTAEKLIEFKKKFNQFETSKRSREETKDAKPLKSKKAAKDTTTFMTEASVKEGKDISEEKDVILLKCWKAHTDGITWVTFNSDPPFFVSSSFDKNVYIWNEDCVRIGSLVLGHDKFWNIHIDKSERLEREKKEADDMLAELEKEDNEFNNEKDKSTKERDLKIMEQIKASTLRRTQKDRTYYDDV